MPRAQHCFLALDSTDNGNNYVVIHTSKGANHGPSSSSPFSSVPRTAWAVIPSRPQRAQQPDQPTPVRTRARTTTTPAPSNRFVALAQSDGHVMLNAANNGDGIDVVGTCLRSALDVAILHLLLLSLLTLLRLISIFFQ